MYESLYDTHRVEKYTVDILDRHDNKIGELGEVVGGTITASVDARIKTGGKLELKTHTPIDWWGTYRLQVWAHANQEKWSLGVFIPSAPEKQYEENKVSITVELADKLIILDKDCIDAPLSIPPRTRLTTWITNFIISSGETNLNITPSNEVNKRAMTWDAGTPKLTVINDILDYLDYFSLSATPHGQFTAAPYVIPQQRPINWYFGQDAHSLTSRNFVYRQDLDSIPNKTVYIVQSATTLVNGVKVEGTLNRPMVAVATNTDPNSPYSYQARGRWITHVATDIEARNQKDLQQKANRYMQNCQDPFTRVQFSTAIFPVQLNHLARFTTKNYDLVGAVRQIEYTLKPASLMNITIRKSKYAIK